MTKSDAQILGQPITFPNGLTAPNRFLKSAMTERLCTYSDDNESERGKPTPEYIRLYEEWGKGEIGTIVLGNIPVKRDGLEAKKNAVIDPDSDWDAVEAFKPVIAAAKRHGMLCIGQLTHGGRQVSDDIVKTPVSSSDIQNAPAMGMSFGKPRPLEESEIEDLIERWANAAEVLYKAGADGAQLHGAHGYLLSQVSRRKAGMHSDYELTAVASLLLSPISSSRPASTSARTSGAASSRTSRVSSSASSTPSTRALTAASFCSRSSSTRPTFPTVGSPRTSRRACASSSTPPAST